jgi:DNA-3-methyladenine glycosylase II
MIPHYWEEGKTYLSKHDKTLKAIIKTYPGDALTLRGDAFFTLARAIVGQQISVKAADSVWARCVTAAEKMTPEVIANMDAIKLRECGLSASKVIYLHALANHFLEYKKRIESLPEMTDAEVVTELTTIKGIGKWSAEMFLIFSLGRPDVFPTADLGLIKGIWRYYNNGNAMEMADIMLLGESWKPYRSIATWYMWRALDPVPVAY